MTILVVHALATWYMVGLIWTIQIGHYPLHSLVDETTFVAYEVEHSRRMGRLLALPATAEVVTGAALVWTRPAGVDLTLVLVAGALLAAAWVTTAVVHVPMHKALSRARDADRIRRLVRSNWWRTAAWSARGGLVGAMLMM